MLPAAWAGRDGRLHEFAVCMANDAGHTSRCRSKHEFVRRFENDELAVLA